MKRNVDFNEISDGKKYNRENYVKVGCDDCKNCSECCKVTDDTIHLDPFDINLLSKKLGKSFEGMLNEGIINITLIDGVITPYLCKNENSECVFLDNGRCKIHEARPGFCRLFPLGRIYDEDGSFAYFIQVHECPYPMKTEVKVSDWLGIESLPLYEEYIVTWHEIIKSISETALKGNSEMLKMQNMNLLNKFFIAPYGDNFYEDFYNRL